MRTTWNGSISFGLVNIPVGLSPATAPAARQSDVQFRMLHRTCMTPIKQKRWCPVHDVEVGPDELVRGWEVAKGQFVPIEDEELEAIEQRGTSHTIDVSRFVKADEVDPVYFDRTYYLVPGGTEAQRRPYALLLAAKLEGREIAEPTPAAPETPVVDLMEALRASVAASKAGGKKPASSGRKPAARKRAAAGRK